MNSSDTQNFNASERFCSHCSHPLGTHDRFCGNCGAKLDETESIDVSSTDNSFGCPPRKQLVAYANQRLKGAAPHEIKSHVERCERCKPLLASIIESLEDSDRTHRTSWVETRDATVADMPSDIGRYSVRELLGEGAFGSVFLAVDTELSREVALKLQRRGDRSSEHVSAFQKEAQVLASMDHPHILPVYDVGRLDDGRWYVVSKYIDGSDLASLLSTDAWDPTAAARLIATAADALQHAHSRKLIHRDLKPANILIRTDGHAYIADFGLALTGRDYGDTAVPQGGTVAYMSPEQVQHKGHVVDGRSDIYSLGVVLYELLVGERPFSGRSREDMFSLILTVDPRPPRQIKADIPVELEAICLRAMAKSPRDRFLTAIDMADALKRYLDKGASAHSLGPGTQLPIPSSEEIATSHLMLACADIDNEPLNQHDPGWVVQLQQNLAQRLKQLLGESVNVICLPCRDDAILPIDEELVRAMSRARTLVPVVSPAYLRCASGSELVEQYLSNLVESPSSIPDRLLAVVKVPIGEDELPQKLASVFPRVVSFEFFSKDPITGTFREYHERFGTDAKQRYYECLYDLAHEVYLRIKASETPTSSLPSGPVVYLAMSSSDVKGECDRIRRELQAQGIRVLPEAPLPLEIENLKSEVVAQLEESSLCLTILGRDYGVIPEGTSKSQLEVQLEVASACSNVKRIAWLPRSVTVRDTRQQTLIEQLQSGGLTDRFDFVVDDVEAVKRILANELSQEDVAPDAVNVAGIYLMCCRDDESEVEPIEDFLFDRGFEVSLPDFEASEAEAAEIHREQLLNCRGVLIYYGSARDSWVNIKLRDTLKIRGYGRAQLQKPFVYVAPPVNRRKQRFKSHLADHATQEGERFEPDRIERFLRQLSQGQ